MPSSPFQRLWKFISYVSQQLGHIWLPFICLAVWISLAESNKLPKQMNGNQKWPSYCETYEMNFHRRWKGDDGIYFGCRFWFHCLYAQNGLFLEAFFTPMAFLEYDMSTSWQHQQEATAARLRGQLRASAGCRRCWMAIPGLGRGDSTTLTGHLSRRRKTSNRNQVMAGASPDLLEGRKTQRKKRV